MDWREEIREKRLVIKEKRLVIKERKLEICREERGDWGEKKGITMGKRRGIEMARLLRYTYGIETEQK